VIVFEDFVVVVFIAAGSINILKLSVSFGVDLIKKSRLLITTKWLYKSGVKMQIILIKK
jgi:hypothetical protein